MEYMQLKECAYFSKVRTLDIHIDTYISTDNMLPNKGGVVTAESLPSVITATKYEENDILISNIRPYFCKIWLANRVGSCSNDVLVIKSRSKINAHFLLYVLSDNNFFNYATVTAKGTKMPRGTPHAIMRYLVPNFNYTIQTRIASILSAYDDAIENNKKRIAILEKMASELYKEWFVRMRFPGYETAEYENGLPKGWKDLHIRNITSLKSGYAFKSEWFVEEGEAVAKIKDIGQIVMDINDFSFVEKSNCEKAKRFLLVEGDLTIALTGATIGKISIVPKHSINIFTNQRLGKFFNGKDPIKQLPFLYCFFSRPETTQAILNISNSSSAQPNISPEQIEQIRFLGNMQVIALFNKKSQSLLKLILSLYYKNTNLAKQRDLLLPRLMSGKLEV